ncbi:hypothetical protein ACS0TY_021862 [Phlomoides rotata]
MAENRFKIRIRRILRSCKSKDQINDVVDTHRSPYLSPEVNGRKCPPSSPIISPMNSNVLYLIPKERKKGRKKKKKGRFAAYKKYSGFEDVFSECQYNGLFSSDEETIEESRISSSAASSRRRMEAVADSLAVVKCSSDPYSDFRTSMVEMVVENKIFAAKDLENLLQCFLSLNADHHHQIIIQVFAEICEALLM